MSTQLCSHANIIKPCLSFMSELLISLKKRIPISANLFESCKRIKQVPNLSCMLCMCIGFVFSFQSWLPNNFLAYYT